MLAELLFGREAQRLLSPRVAAMSIAAEPGQKIVATVFPRVHTGCRPLKT